MLIEHLLGFVLGMMSQMHLELCSNQQIVSSSPVCLYAMQVRIRMQEVVGAGHGVLEVFDKFPFLLRIFMYRNPF